MRKALAVCGMMTAFLGFSATAALAHRYAVADPCGYTRFCDDGNFPCRVNILYPPGAHALNFDYDGWLLDAHGHRALKCINVTRRGARGNDGARYYDHNHNHHHH
jgi:hypothetical protein